MDAIPRYPAMQAYNCFRPLQWRWDRARQLADRRRPFSRCTDDDITIAAAEFLRAYDDPRRRTRLKDLCPALWIAQDIATRDSRDMWEVRARILAGQSDDAIARYCNIPSEVIGLYESLFFNVRDRLRARDWILIQTIRLGSSGFIDCEISNLWAAFGYFGGPCVLDVVIKVSRNADAPDWPLADDAGDGPAERSARMAIAALMIPPDAPERQVHELNLAHRRYELARKKPRDSLDVENALSSFANVMSTVIAAPDTQENSVAVA